MPKKQEATTRDPGFGAYLRSWEGTISVPCGSEVADAYEPSGVVRRLLTTNWLDVSDLAMETLSMAVTLQLARVTAGQLSACRRSVAELDKLCSFDLLPASEYLDLDWADDALIQVCEHAGIGDVVSLRRATDGDDEVNPAYDEVMERPKALEPADVVTLATALHGIDLEAVLSALPSDYQELIDTVGGILTEFSSDPRPYLRQYFAALRDFYTVAADRHLAIVIWCD